MTILLHASGLSAVALLLAGAVAPPAGTVPKNPAPALATVKASPAAVAEAAPEQSRRPHRGPPLRSRNSRTSAAIGRIAVANRAATLTPQPHGFLNAVQVYPFAEGTLFQVYAAPERVTDIALQPGEVLGAVASGDTVRWVVGDTSSGTGADKRTHILVKPFSAGLSTNLVITTDRRTYHLALVSSAGAAMAAMSWIYPQDALIALKRAEAIAQAAVPVATGLEVERLSFNYLLSGDRPNWRPVRAFDDGRQTFIEFPATLGVGEAPPLFLVDAHGEAQLVNYRVSGRFYVVDRLFDAAELRLGTKHQEIVRIARVAEAPTLRAGKRRPS